MDLMEFLTILKQGEGPHVEFKEDFTEQAHKIAKEMVAFANTGGGILLIGVDDNGLPKGIAEPNDAVERLSNIARSCSPPLLPEIDNINLKDNVSIIYAKVPHNPPCLYKGTLYIRVGSTSVEASGGHECETLFKNSWRFKQTPTSVPNMLFSPPPIKGFIGRTRELKQLTTLLKSKTISVIVIDGISGIGKTELSKHFADSVKQEYMPFWMDCREDTSFDSVTYALAMFARNIGNELLSNILEDVTINIEDRINRIAVTLADLKYIIFLDDYHLISDPTINRLVSKIAEHSINSKIILICRQRPRLLLTIRPMLLAEETIGTGLNKTDSAQFLKNCGIDISKDIASKIWQLTGEGHPKALEIFIGRARNYPITELLSDLPVFREELISEWLTPLMNELPEEQRNLAIDLSIFDRPISFQGIKWLYPDKEIYEIMIGLIDRFILDRFGIDSLRMHLLVRDFCYSLITDKHSKHIWAAEYYLYQSGEYHDIENITDIQIDSRIAAWSHLIKAEEHMRATEELEKLRGPLMNRGQYEQLMFLIEQTPLSPGKEDWRTIDKARIISFWGDFVTAVTMILPLIDSPDERIAREAVLVLSTIYNDHDKGDLSKGLLEKYYDRFIKNVHSRTRRRFLSRLVEAYSMIGDLDQSLKWASIILESCDAEGEEISGAISLRQIAVVLKTQKKFDTAISICQRSYDLLKKNNRLREAALTEMVIASIYKEIKEFKSALECLNNSLQAFISMSDRKNCTIARSQIMEIQHMVQ